MPRYTIYDNGLRAIYRRAGWDNATFNNFEDAVEYAIKWLGQWHTGQRFRPDDPFDYTGCGDIIEIREEK